MTFIFTILKLIAAPVLHKIMKNRSFTNMFNILVTAKVNFLFYIGQTHIKKYWLEEPLTCEYKTLLQPLSCVWLFVTPCLQHARPPCPSPTPRVYLNSCPLSWWCYPTISSSVVPFSSYLQSFRTSGSLQMSQFFSSGGQSIGVSASTSVLIFNHNLFLHWNLNFHKSRSQLR